MVNYMFAPCFKVTTTYGEDTFTFENDQFLKGMVTRRENGFDIATLLCNDKETVNWLDKMSAGSAVTVGVKDKRDSDYTKIFDGVARFLNLPMQKGWFIELECDGAGYGFGETSCGEQYGTQSDNPTLDTIYEILTDSSHGIIPKWVNKVLGTAVDSGYNYTSIVQNIAGSMRYHYFPYKPCNKSINDVCDVLQAIKGTSAGPHWIVTTDNKFLLSTMGNHHDDVVDEGWTTYLGGLQAASTLEEGKDFKEFNFQELEKEANYILYHGKFKKPSDSDYWTENSSSLWHTSDDIDDDNVNYKMGSYSIKGIASGPGGGITMWYPEAGDAAWDFTKIGGKHNIPTLNFWAMRNNQTIEVKVSLDTRNDAGILTGAYWYILQSQMSSVDTWYYFALPVGPYALASFAEGFKGWLYGGVVGAADWSEIDDIRFEGGIQVGEGDQYVWVDGLFIDGWVLRGARPSDAYSSTNPLKLKLINDDMGKDDSLVASDDSGMMAQLAYAELLRCKTTPMLGHFTTPMIKDALPGQLTHIHAKKKRDGTFAIDKDFRITKLIQHFSIQGYFTEFFVTDDVTNSICRTSFSDLNKVLADARPEFQDRQASSIKTREIDITQPILEKSY